MRNLALARRALPVLAALFATALVVPAIVLGHAVVFPKASGLGAHERYVLRVPNEKAVPTTKVEIHFPDSVKVSAFEDVAGWQLEVQVDSAKRITGAVWTGTLAPQRFVEFPFVATNPKTATKIVWPVFQTYAEGARVEWTGEEGSKSPASVTTIGAATEPGAPSGITAKLPWIAFVISVVALGLALRKPSARVA